MSPSPKRNRRRFTAKFKAEVALAALQERALLAALTGKSTLTPAQITSWKQQLKHQAAQVFAMSTPASEAAVDVEALYAQLGRLQMENALLKNAGPMSAASLRDQVRSAGEGSSVARCQVLGLARSSYLPAARGKCRQPAAAAHAPAE